MVRLTYLSLTNGRSAGSLAWLEYGGNTFVTAARQDFQCGFGGSIAGTTRSSLCRLMSDGRKVLDDYCCATTRLKKIKGSFDD